MNVRSELREHLKYQKSGPGCSKLTTSLVNVSLKFQSLYFWLKKMSEAFALRRLLSFLNKNISVFAYKAVQHLPS